MEIKIIRNRIRCKQCGDIIESKSVHDFKFCSCGKVAIDGGHHYLKRSGNPNDWEELSEFVQIYALYDFLSFTSFIWASL